MQVLFNFRGPRVVRGDDEIHPNAAGARRIAETVWPYLEPLVQQTVTTASTR